jgi:hypothetical protein
MAYILQYFDDLIEETGMYYNKRNRISLNDRILSEEIRKEGMLIQDKLREIYYKEGEEQWIVPYFLKISKRLISLLKTIELEIRARKPHLIIEYREWANISYENLHSVRREILGILDILNFEFEVPGVDVEKVSESGEQKILRETYFNDHLLLKTYVLEKKEIPQELINKYELGYILDDLTPEYFQYSKLHSLKEELGIDTIKSTFSIEEIEEEYKRDFINERQERSFVYTHIWEMLIDNTKDIISEEEKKNNIINFFLHTGLCVSLVVHYFDREIQVLENSNTEDVGTYLKKMSDWLDEVKAEPKYRKYHVSRIEDSYEDIFEELSNLLSYYEELYLVKKKDELDEGTQGEEKSPNEKIEYVGTLESLGLFTYLLFESNLFKRKSMVQRTARVLAKSFKANKEEDFSWSTVKDYFSEGERQRDDENVPFLIDKFTQMLKELKKMKKDYNYK